MWEIVAAAGDPRSQSTEMLAMAEGWAEQYHTHPARANILRALDIPAGATILEIGSGCGPITRYLGETGAEVDSVEPVLPRARVGRQRTLDLPNVEVFCGNLEDIPTDADYDIVVVVGVLEYVGAGAPDRAAYLSFLEQCRMRLRSSGALVLAIENKLGVKYLTGTAEDHSGRIFDSVEDYPRGTPARTFSSGTLCDLVAQAGLTPKLFGVFPDYKHTRVVFDTDALQVRAPDLLENLAAFPSRYAGTRSLKLASELRVWRELVRDGVGAHFANSFLVVATGGEQSALWPSERLAKYFSVDRQPAYATSTCVNEIDGEITFDRTFSSDPGSLIKDGMSRWDYVAGRSFLQVFHDSGDAERRDLLRRWIDLVTHASAGDVVPVDAIPTNLIVSESGEIHLIDNEFHDTSSTDRVVVRGLFWMAVHITRDTPPESWAPARTVRDVVNYLADLVGIEFDDEAIERLQADEASFQVTVTSNYLRPDGLDKASNSVRRLLDWELRDAPLGRRLFDVYDDLVKSHEHLRTHYTAAITQRDGLQDRLDHAIAQRDRLRAQKKKASATQERTQARLRASKQEIADLRRELKSTRAAAARTERALASIQRSRAHRVAEHVRRRVGTLKSVVGRRR